MTEWIIVIWLVNCGFGCDTTGMPTFPPYETQHDCEYALNEYLKDGGKKWEPTPIFGPAWNRRGRCEERVIDD